MRLFTRTSFVALSSTFCAVALLTSLALSQESDAAKPKVKKHHPRTTTRTLAQSLQSVDQVTVAEGFVIRLYTDQQVNAYRKKTEAHNSRHQEYLTKRAPWDKRLEEIRQRLPTRTLNLADSSFGRFDRDSNGKLSAEEQSLSRGNLKPADANSDGIVSKNEFRVWMFGRLGSRSGDSGRPPANPIAPGDVDKLLKESAKVESSIYELAKQYQDVRRRRSKRSYYRMVEASAEFLRLRSDTEERIIPYASIREFRRSLSGK